MSDSESALIERAKQGDRGAFVEIYERFYDLIHNYIYLRIFDEAITQDLTAEVFVRMVAHIDKFTYRKQTILAWLYVIARNLVADHYRTNNHTTPLALNEQEPVISPAPLELVEAKLTQAQLAATLGQLTEEQRLVIIFKFVEGHSNHEIARLLGKSEGAVKALQYRALAAMQRILVKEFGYETF
ncbi:MAG: sigma-70 family RNA polymerase sigma factor [Anaerolineae bacterium]|nr:sigma-70 family RNA polymerase sigma factor [Anaerolineae bacterium]